MTSPTTGTQRSRRTDSGSVAGLPKPARQRRPVLVVVGLVLAALAAALVAALLNAATATTLVWTTATEVSRGHVVEADDLAAVEVAESAAGSLLEASVASRAELVGQVWAADLPAGHLLSPSLITEGVAVGEGMALVGLRLDPGEFPIVGLRPGDVVQVIEAAAQQGDPPQVLVDAAVVESVAVLGDQGAAASRLITLSVPDEAAAAVANAGGAGRASIAVVAP
jgi:hypothetical protein